MAPHIVVIPEIIPGDMTQISSFVYQICHKEWRLSFGSQVSFPSLGLSFCDSVLRYHKMIDQLITISAQSHHQVLQIPPTVQ